MAPHLLPFDQAESIARRCGFDTLETRNIDRLDFHEISAASFKEALEAAYALGRGSR